MSSNRLLVPSVHGQTPGQGSRGFSCTEKYDWQNLTLHQSEQAITEQPDHDATLHCPLNMHTRAEDSVMAHEISHAPRGSHDLYGTRGEIVNNRFCATRGVNRLEEYTASHGHGHSSEIHGPGNGVGGPYCLSSCSYGGGHSKDHACLGNTSKQARRSISPGRDPFISHRTKRSPPFNHAHRCVKGADRQMCQAGSCRKNCSANQRGNSQNQNRHYDDDRYLPNRLDFLDGHFSDVRAARHRSYMCNSHSSSKQKGNSWKDPTSSHGRSCRRHELARAHPKRPPNEFCSHYHEQLELSPNEDFHESLDSHQNFRSAYNGKMIKRKFIKQGFHENTYNGACTSKYGRNSNQKRKADYFDGNKTRKNVAYGEKSKRLCWPSEKDQEQQVETGNRNDSLERSAETTRFVGQNGGTKKNATAPAASGPTKCDENSKSPECSKTIASLNMPNVSQGSDDMDLESDEQSDVDGCTERGTLQHLLVTHTEGDVQLKELDNLSQSEALRQDCLILWRARKIRKASVAKADKIIEPDQQQTGQRSNVLTGRRVRNGRPAAFATSESDNEDDHSLVCSDQLSSATSSDGLQKCGEGRAKKKFESPLKFPSNSKSNRSPQNVAAEHPDAEVHSGLNGCSDTSKMDQVSVSHCDSSVHHNISQQETHNADKRKERLGGHGAKWAEQSTSLYADPTLLSCETGAPCSMDGNGMVNALETQNHESGSTTFHGSILDIGAANMCQEEPIDRPSESYCGDFKNWVSGNDRKDNEQEAMDHDLLRKKQVCSLLADPENELNENYTKETELQALRVENTSNRWMTTMDGTANTIHSGSAKLGDWISCSSIPDLNFSPGMTSDEDFVASEEPVCQVTTDGFISQNVTKSLSASVTGAIGKEEQYEQVKEEQCKVAEANEIIREVCRKEGTSEVATQLEISESNTGPPHPQRSAVEGSGPSMDAFRCALCEFVKIFIKPLWDKGLLSREVHKIVVKKAVEKVAGAWASNAPSAEPSISRIVSEEAKNIERLVQGYLNVYVGREILKSVVPGSS